MEPVFFSNQQEFRKWLEQNHEKESELVVGFYKVNSGKQNMTWSQSVDQALCFGWIDSVRKSIDSESYCIRFTPRRPGSKWSAVNIMKMESLIQKGLLHPAGLKIFTERKSEPSAKYSYENRQIKFSSAFEGFFKSNMQAWDFFKTQAPSYQKNIILWIMDAKQEVTRHRRLEKAIKASEEGRKLF